MKKLFTTLLLTTHYAAHIFSHPSQYFKKLSEDSFQICYKEKSNEKCTTPFSSETIKKFQKQNLFIQDIWNEFEIACLKKDATLKQELAAQFIKSFILSSIKAQKAFIIPTQTTPITAQSKNSILSDEESNKLGLILFSVISLPLNLSRITTENMPRFLMDKPTELETFTDSFLNCDKIKDLFHLFSEAEQQEILETKKLMQEIFPETTEPVKQN